MNFKKDTTKKIFSAFLLILVLMPTILFFAPKKANAIPVEIVEDASKTSWITSLKSIFIGVTTAQTATQTSISAGIDLKEWALEILKQTLTTLAKKFLQKMTESTVNWINSGFHGAPLFLERPESFFKDIAKYEIKRLVTSIGYDNGRFPFGKSFAINAINSYKSTFERNAQYSLSKVVNDPALLERFRNDFSLGGWDGFLLNTQFPKNNYVGSNMMQADYLNQVLAGTTQNAASDIKNILEQGNGFLTPKKCETNPNYNKFKNQFQQPTYKRVEPNCPPPEATGDNAEYLQCISAWRTAEDAREAEWNKTNACPARPNGTSGFVSTTPGSVVADQIMNSLTSGKRQGELAIAMGNSLSAIFDALLNQFMAKGLNALSSKSNTPGSDDDFNYYGNTLNATTTGTSGTFDWNQVKDKPDDIDKLQYDGTKFIDKNILIEPTTIYCPAGTTGTPPNCVTTTPVNCDTVDGFLRPIPADCNPVVN